MLAHQLGAICHAGRSSRLHLQHALVIVAYLVQQVMLRLAPQRQSPGRSSQLISSLHPRLRLLSLLMLQQLCRLPQPQLPLQTLTC